MFAYTYPILDLFWTMLLFFLFIMWIWLLIAIFGDIFRSDDLGGFAKALWVIFVIFLPFLGVFVYLIARGSKMQRRSMERAQAEEQALNAHIKEVTGSATSVDQLTKLADLKSRGIITEAEFDAEKAKLIG